MSQVDLRGNIILDGQTTSGFDSLAGKITSMARAVQMVGDKIWEFEKESLEIYKDYETNMLQARAALSSTYDSSVELDKVMDTLAEHVQDWAQHSIFHVKDFSGAVNNAAHAGWTLEQQLEGIPQAMLLAQAGGMDLTDGLEYLARALNVTGTDFKDSGTLVDQWVKASHLANLTIEDLGDSLNRMGVTAQLTDSTAELFTMLDALASTGSVGSEAGTLLRGTIMRLIAPTKKATEAMEQLEVTQDEYNELAADAGALAEANKLLEAQGFSAYDTNGQLKPLMQTYGELYDALVAIAGSEEDLLTNSEVDKILAAIFPQRQISGALSFLQAVKNGWGDLYEEIKNSEGTAQADADIMMSGLMGAEELFKSKWEEFQRKVGEELSSPFESILEFLGGVVDALNNMPQEVLDGLLGGLTGIAALGSALGVGSGVAFFFSHLGPWGTAAVVAAFGIGALAAYLSKLEQAQFDSKFGDMALDIDALKESLVNFETPGDEGRKAVDEWTKDVSAIAEAYSGLAESFAQELKLDTLTNATLTQDDLDKLQKLGASMQSEVLKGISTAAKRDQTSVNALFGLTSEDDYENLSAEDQALYNALSQSFEDYYSDLSAEAYAVGENIRDMLTAALKNGDLTPEDEAAIKAQIDRYNKIMAEIADAQRAEDMKTMMNAAQRVSRESYEAWMNELDGEYASAIEEREQYWDREKAKIDVQHEKGYLKGYYSEDERRWISPDEVYQRELAKIAEGRAADVEATKAYFGQLADEATNSALYDTEWGKAWGFVRDQYAKGNIAFDENGVADFSNLDFSGIEDMSGMADSLNSLFGNRGFFKSLLSAFGDFEETQNTMDLLDSLSGAAAAVENEANRQTWIEETNTESNVPPSQRTVEYGSVVDTRSELSGLTGEQLREQMYAIDQYIQQHGVKESQAELDRWIAMNKQLGELEGDGQNPFYDWWDAPAWYTQAINEGLTPEPVYTEPEPEPEPEIIAPEPAEQADLTQTAQELQAVNDAIASITTEMTQNAGNWIQELFRNPQLEQLLNGGTDEAGNQFSGLYERQAALEAQMTEADRPGASEYDRDLAEKRAEVERLETEMAAIASGIAQNEAILQEATGLFADSYKRDSANGYLNGWTDAGGNRVIGAYQRQENLNVQYAAAQSDFLSAATGQTVDVQVNGDTTELNATIQAEDGQTLLQYVDGDVSDLHMAIYDEDGQTLLEYVDGNAAALGRAIEAYNGKTITVNIKGNKLFAEGGRATEASIFGEAGPEWAIPEAHTERTAELLNAARAASGFTWDDLISRYGGLNADPNHVNVNLSYAPTINAANAEGVESVLARDKERIKKLVEEAVKRVLDGARLRDDVEVYA